MESSFDAETLMMQTEILEDELKKVGLKVKHHEDNLRFLKSEIDSIDESILDMQAYQWKYRATFTNNPQKKQHLKLSNFTVTGIRTTVSLGRYHSRAPEESSAKNLQDAEEETLKRIMEGGSAAAIVCQMKYRHGVQALKVPFMKDVLGIVATLCRVTDANLSRLFSEFLGKENMLGIVCKTYEGVKAIERYDKQGMVEMALGLHGLGSSIGRALQGRFIVFCLENLRPFSGDFKPDDPQRRLQLQKPRLPNGELPPGFLGFAVNMIYVDHMHLSFLTPKGHGLRETLLYNLFSRLQVYRTRSDMFRALPCISDGAVSLDGAFIRRTGVFYLGNRENVEVKFPVTHVTSNLPVDIRDTEEQIKLLNWRRERLLEDTKREETLLDHVKSLFSDKKQEMMEFGAKLPSTRPQNLQLQLIPSKNSSSKLKNSMIN